MRVGILGAGQLGRMMALAGLPMGIDFVFYTPIATPSILHLGRIVIGEYDDYGTLKTFAECVDIITYESENIPQDTLSFLEKTNINVFPPKESLNHMQDRLMEKLFFNRLSIPTNDFYQIDNKEQLLQLSRKGLLPLVLKKRKNSYDGKGQVIIKSERELEALSESQCSDCIAEAFVPFQREVSIIGVRSQSGMSKFYDLCENMHHQGTLNCTENKQFDSAYAQAKEYLTEIMTQLNYVGVCTLELFEVNQCLLANELAPRVHNSGHWTIEGAVTSQFENHLRAILNLPLGDVKSYGPFLMRNLLSKIPSKIKLLAENGLKLHDYIKTPQKGRKLGHVTVSQSTHPRTAQEVKSMATN